MNCMQPAIKTVAAIMNGMDRLNVAHRIAAIANPDYSWLAEQSGLRLRLRS
jgi:hypothetical protein